MVGERQVFSGRPTLQITRNDTATGIWRLQISQRRECSHSSYKTTSWINCILRVSVRFDGLKVAPF